MLIVFDGLDGVGKTTLAKEIAKKFEAKYFRCFLPNDEMKLKTLINNKENSINIHKNSIKYIEKRCCKILSFLKSNKNVVLDRYIYSSIAYYYAITKMEKNIVKIIDYNDFNLLKPNASFIILLDAKNIKYRSKNKLLDNTDKLSIYNKFFIKNVTNCFNFFQETEDIFFIKNNNNLNKTISKILDILNNVKDTKPNYWIGEESINKILFKLK